MSESPIFLAAKSHQETARQHRRLLHQNPELAFQEYKTSDYAAKELEKLGFDVRRGIGKTGLVATLAMEHSGPRFLLRFDMDALAVQEQTGLEFTSMSEGTMHACGHDGHVAIGLTIAKLVSEMKKDLAGSYHLLFQPAEEIGEGAAAMIADGVLELIQPDYALAVHLWPEEPTGWLGISSGPVMAGCRDVSIKVHGIGGHGGRPQKAVDPIIASAHLITALQSIVSRNLDPLDSGVYSITQVHAGTNNNVIPDSAFMTGKPRFFSGEAEDVIIASTHRICDGIARAFGCEIDVEFGGKIPPTVNDPQVCEAACLAALKIDPDIVIGSKFKLMGSEDMSLFLEKIPGAMLFVGAGKEGSQNRFPLHHPCMDIDESSLVLAASLLLETCQQLAATAK